MNITPAYQQALKCLPLQLHSEAIRFLEDIPDELLTGDSLPEDWPETLVTVVAASPFVAQTIIRRPDFLLNQIKDGSLFKKISHTDLNKSITANLEKIDNEQELSTALREIRYQHSLRIAWRDLAGWADLEETLGALSNLADVLVSSALEKIQQWTSDKLGEPIGELSNSPASLYIYALGKLGGRELNFSSDIDLIFFYSEDGETKGKDKKVTNHEFFIKVSQQLIKILNEQTKDGFVFRVDMRLRPNGKSGPLAMSFTAAENYYLIHGREWERYAWIKARLIAGDEKNGNNFLESLKPYVFRKYLDYGTIEAIRSLKESINQELRRKKISNNIKLGPGGIREIEFIGQTFQLIRGGRDLSLQRRGILKILNELGKKEYITPRAITELSIAYDFLRRTENRLQMVAEQQTHVLPKDQDEQIRLAASMDFSDWDAFKASLDKHMGRVHSHFDLLVEAPQREQDQENKSGLMEVWSGALDQDEAITILESHNYQADSKQILQTLQSVHEGKAYGTYTSTGKARFDQLIPLLLAAAGLAKHPAKTLLHLLNVLEAIGRRSAYLALLVENPLALSQLVKLCSASGWIADWIAQHPLLLDELLNPVSTYDFPDKKALAKELRDSLQGMGEEELENNMELLREFCNRHVLYLAAAEVGPGVESKVIGTQLSLIADVIIEESLKLSQEAMKIKHGLPQCNSGSHGFAVIGYGKLGGHELGFGSDVDIIFLYDNCSQGDTDGARPIANETFFARVSKRLIHILTTRTHGGILYEVDARLRPSGKSGPIVTSLDAFIKYQKNRAWTWEYQALVRARPVAGDEALSESFRQARKQILCQKRDAEDLRKDVSEMRVKMMEAQKPHAPEEFDIKHDRGGIVDVEFMVQYWVLVWAFEHPDLTQHTENGAILQALAQAGLIDPEQARFLISAYQQFLSTVYHLKLMQADSRLDGAAREQLGDIPNRVAKIWEQVMEHG